MNVEKMDPALKAKWVAALKSGKYIQHHGGWLNHDATKFCCVTVLFQEAGHEAMQPGPRECAAALGIPDQYGEEQPPVGSLQHFINMNDLHRLSFLEIANYIESPRPLPEKVAYLQVAVASA